MTEWPIAIVGYCCETTRAWILRIALAFQVMQFSLHFWGYWKNEWPNSSDWI
jgi:hypothetical protein